MRRLEADGADLWSGRARLVKGLRFALWCATALWVPVLLARGDTTAQARAYDTVRWVAAELHLPALGDWLAPGELLVAAMALACAGFSAVDYLIGGSRFSPARVWLAAIFWLGLAASYLVANPIGYGSWLFVGIALVHMWCLRQARK